MCTNRINLTLYTKKYKTKLKNELQKKSPNGKKKRLNTSKKIQASLFVTAKFSRKNTFFTVGLYGLFLTWVENKGVCYAHTILYIYMIILVLMLPHADLSY